MIYADYNGSAPLCQQVKDYLVKRLDNGPYANPNAIHYLGAKTMMGMENARNICAKILNAHPSQLTFNSGATEGISTVFHSVLQQTNKKTIIISSIEHSAVTNTAKYYESHGFNLVIVPVDTNGVIDLNFFNQSLKTFKESIAIVSIMAANNETGVIQPWQKINKSCQENKIPYFCDTTQYIGKVPFDFENSNIDYAVCSGHKLGAMTGTGILLSKNPETLLPMIIGGGQEHGHRGGTQHYIGNETLAIALTSIQEKFKNIDYLAQKRISFESKIKSEFPEVVILGENTERLATTTYIAYPGIHGQAVQIELESNDIFVTTSSACSDNMPVTSKVLRAMNVSDDVGRGVIRVSLGLCANPETYDTLSVELSKAYKKLLRVKSF